MNEKANSERLEQLRAAHTADPANRETAIELAQLYADLGWYNESLDLYRELLEHYENDYALMLDYGNVCFRREDHKEAVDTFRKLTELKPTRIEGWNNLGIVQMTLENHEEAREAFGKVLELEPDNAGALLNMGNYHHKRGNLEEAGRMFERAVKTAPDFSDGWFNLGNVCRERSEFEKAAEAYRKALRYRQDFPSALKNLGLVCEQLGREDEAESCYREALKYSRADGSLYSNLASLYTRQKRYDEAKENFVRAVKLAPRDLAGWMGLRHLSLVKGDIASYLRASLAVVAHLDGAAIAATCATLRMLGRYEDCETVVKRADALRREGDELDAERLLVYQRSGSSGGKMAAIERRLAGLKDPSHEVRIALGEYYYFKGDYARTVALLEGVDSPAAGVDRLRWRALIAGGRLDEAHGEIVACLDDRPDSFDAWFALARVYIRQGQVKKARAALTRAMENGFGDVELLEEEPQLKELFETLSATPDHDTRELD